MGTVKALGGLLVVVLGAYLAFQLIPPYFANYQLRDSIYEIAKFAPVSSKSDEDIRNDVLKKAREYEIPLTAEQVKVTREDKSVIISVDYTRTVNLVGGKSYTFEFHDTTGK